MRTVIGTVLLTATLALTGCGVSLESASPAEPAPEHAAVDAAAVDGGTEPSGEPSADPGADGGGTPTTAAGTGTAPAFAPTPGTGTGTGSGTGTGNGTTPSSDADPRPGASTTAPGDAAATPAPATPEAPVEVAAPELPVLAADPPPVPDDGQLRQGDSGPAVLAVQQRLTELGYWLGTPDGEFGTLTTQAVLAVQKAGGLSRDGVVGPRTLAALEAGTRPEARLGGDGVEIDLDRQLLLVVRGGEVRTVLNTSTGVLGRHDTPRGSFRVQRAIDGLRVAPLGELWRPRYFNGGIAVHGSPNIPAHAASHGCARLSDAAIDMVWADDLMPIGSSVTVY